MGKYKFGDVTIIFAPFTGDIDVDSVTETHYQNLHGEQAETTRILNGLTELKADVEDTFERAKLETKRIEAMVKQEFRRKAAKNGGKVTTKGVDIKVTDEALKELFRLDKRFIEAANSEYKAKKDFDIVSPLYWAVKAKNDKLNHIASGGKKMYYNLDED